MLTFEAAGVRVTLRPATAEDDLYAPYLHAQLAQRLHPDTPLSELPPAAFAPVIAFVQMIQQSVNVLNTPFAWPGRFAAVDEQLRAYRWLLHEPAQRALAQAWVDALARVNAAPAEGADPK
jgi:hypothetical protein